ncbi:MAG: AAA family ATPase [Pleurocapsa sp. MO_226.B13]|nr:AAA family ATPase [Pleurocapsa sp. MO_226.B13]
MFTELQDLFQNTDISTIQLHASDYELALKQLLAIYCDRYEDNPVFYWNNGYQNLVRLELVEEKLKYNIVQSNEQFDTPLALILQNKLSPGLYIFDNLLDFDRLSAREKSIRESQIYNCASRLEHQSGVQIILLGEWIQLSPKLRLKLKQIELGLPKAQEIERVLQTQLGFQPDTKLISACQGLAWGDIYGELKQFSNNESINELINKFLKLKESKLNNSSLNLEYFSKPEISSVGGNENLSEFLQKLAKLNEPAALRYGIKPPRAMLFVGPPGTGKSLRAKMIARDLGYTLLGISFGDILGSDNADRAVFQLLELAESIGNAILFLDDWDKGLADWESGGAARRIVQKFLTWMQEHNSPVITIATVNRIELLPVELLRRFDDGGIWMIDLPNRGEIYVIFNIYLAKYFPTQFTFNPPTDNVTWTTEQWLKLVNYTPWTMEQWVELIDEAEECTPVEIADVVKTCLTDWYCNLSEEERKSDRLSPVIDFDYLLSKVSQINKASVRASESIQAMRNNAWFAKPASKPDTSPFKLPEEVLLGGG